MAPVAIVWMHAPAGDVRARRAARQRRPPASALIAVLVAHFTWKGARLIILLCSGNKSAQANDIKAAREMATQL
ncbi:hypothetical protein GCM10027159_11530 [Lysobacter terrae]